jgi:energy-coupling factor transport system substrate-specific component
VAAWRLNTRVIQLGSLLVVSIAGIAAFFLPFVITVLPDARDGVPSRSVDASLLLGFCVASVLAIALAEIAREPAAGSLSRSIALLGGLVALDASLRLVPSFVGASPIFALIILVGYVFGSLFGFLMGALTLLLSAAITAGVGPWLPFQMLCAGWAGATAGLLPRSPSPSRERVTLMVWGALTGFGFGALMNLYAWPFAAPGTASDAGLYWSPSLSLGEAIGRYAAFYVATSLVHDATRAAATAALLVATGPAVLRLLDRFKAKSQWTSSGQTP